MIEYTLLVYGDTDTSSFQVITGKDVFVGRAEGCDIVLNDSLVSRTHARFFIHENSLYVKDLGSRNGVYVNGSRVSKTVLMPRDDVYMGSCRITVLPYESEPKLGNTTSIISPEAAEALYRKAIAKKESDHLPLFFEATRLLSVVFDLDELLEQILDLVFKAVPGERGYILTRDRMSGRFVIRAGRPKTDSEPQISSTVLEYVCGKNTAVLTLCAESDQRFSESESVFDYNIQSVLCVPLAGQSEVLGAIYVDSGEQFMEFENEHLELITVIGRIVGIALENAELHRENLRTEQLAAIGQATAGIGHCVKNILVGIVGGIDYVRMACETKEWKWAEKGLPLISNASERIQELVLNLLSFSSDRKLVMELSMLRHIVHEAVVAIDARAKKNKVTVRFVGNDAKPIYMDSREVYRVVLNLLINAVEACEEQGGCVTVRTWCDDENGYIEIADDGPGIPQEEQAHIFQAFYSTKGSTGTGLGLACSDRIVRAHGGTIRLKSTLGEGTVFSIVIPNAKNTE